MLLAIAWLGQQDLSSDIRGRGLGVSDLGRESKDVALASLCALELPLP